MSWGTCYNGSNNIHFNYPSFMDDGRNFTNYEATPSLDKKIKELSNIKTNSEYRKYLQNNADQIIKNNQNQACNQCGVCFFKKIDNTDNLNIKEGHPYIFDTMLSNDQPFGYEDSDLKNIYLSRQQLNSQKRAPRYILESQLQSQAKLK